MKQAVFFLTVSVLIFGCKNGNAPKEELHKVYKVLYVVGSGPKKQYNMGDGRVDAFENNYIITDSINQDGHWGKSPIWTLKLPDPERKDTMRDAKTQKPMYDSLSKSYRFNDVWYQLKPEERAGIKVQIIII